MVNKDSVMQFKAFRVKDLSYKLYDEKDELYHDDKFKEVSEGKIAMDLRLGVSVIDNKDLDLNQLDVSLNLLTQKNGNKIEIDILLNGMFEFTEQTELRDDLLIHNGTAIIFPYVRSLVSLISGFDTNNNQIIMPTLNVSSIKKDETTN